MRCRRFLLSAADRRGWDALLVELRSDRPGRHTIGLGFIGFTDIREVFVEPTAGPGERERAVTAANPVATELAGAF